GVPLGNITAEYPEGDEVQAIERWEPPDPWAGIEAKELNAILAAIEAGTTDGRRYSDQAQTEERAAWRVVKAHCPTKGEAQCKEIIRQWLEHGVLFKQKYRDPVQRRDQNGLFVDRNKLPRYE